MGRFQPTLSADMNLALPRLRRAMMLAPIALAAALVACGGSDDNDTPAQQPLALTVMTLAVHPG